MRKMRLWKRTLAGLLSLLIVAGYTPIANVEIEGQFGKTLTAYADDTDPVPVTSIDFTMERPIMVENGYAMYSRISVAPDNATDRTITFSVDNPEVASVTYDGYYAQITPLAPGTAIITATANDGSGVSASHEITVLKNFEVTFSSGDVTKSYALNDAIEGDFLADLPYDFDNYEMNQIDSVTVSNPDRIEVEKIHPDPDDPDYSYWQMVIKQPFTGTEWIRLKYGDDEMSFNVTCWEPEGPQSGQNKYIRYTTGYYGFDVNGRNGDDYIKTTCGNGGYLTQMQVGNNAVKKFENFYFGKPYTDNGVTASVMANIKGKNANIIYTLTNNTDETKTVKIGSSADTQIGKDDHAPVSFTEDGIRMTSIDGSLEFKLIPGEVPFTTRWYGGYWDASGNVFNSLDSTETYTGDSGVAWSWTVEIPPNTTVKRTAALSAGQAGTSTIIYNSNGGEGQMDPTVEIPDGVTTAKLNPNTFTRENYAFLGWDTDSAGKTVVYEDGATLVMPENDLELYAVWKELADIGVTAAGYEGTYDGKAHGITVSVTDPPTGAVVQYGTVEGTYDLPESPSIKDVSDSPLTVYYKITADGYKSKTGSAVVTISKAGSTAATVQANDRVYDGTEQPLVTAGAVQNDCTLYYRLSEDEAWSDTIPTARNAGEYTVYYYTKSNSANYSDSAEENVKVTVSKKELALTWGEGTAYTGAEQTVTASFEKIGEDDVTLIYNGNTGTNADDYTATATLSGTDAGNYTIADGNQTHNWTITKAEKTFTVSLDGWVYGEDAKDPSVSSTDTLYQAAIGADNVKYTYYKGETALDGVPIDAGSNTVKAAITGLTNYADAEKTATFTIEKAAIDPEISIDGWTYGSKANVPTITGNAGKGAETIVYKAKGADDSTYSKDVPTDAGAYTVRVTIAETDNYLGGETTADFTIAKKALTITAKDAEKVYGTDDPAFEYTSDGLVGEDVITGTLTRAKGDDVGEYEITQGTLDAGKNYSITFKAGNLTITPADFSVDASGFDGAYDGKKHGISASTKIPGAKVLYLVSETEPTAADFNKANLTASPSYSDTGLQILIICN